MRVRFAGISEPLDFGVEQDASSVFDEAEDVGKWGGIPLDAEAEIGAAAPSSQHSASGMTVLDTSKVGYKTASDVSFIGASARNFARDFDTRNKQTSLIICESN